MSFKKFFIEAMKIDKILKKLPSDLTKLRTDQAKKMIDELSKVDLKELRKKQVQIVKDQKKMKGKKNEQKLLSLQSLERIISAAVSKKEFGEDVSTSNSSINEIEKLTKMQIGPLTPKEVKKLISMFKKAGFFAGIEIERGNKPSILSVPDSKA